MTQRRSVTRWLALGLTLSLVGLVSQGTTASAQTLAETQQRADQGDADAQYNLGNRYERGLGVSWDFDASGGMVSPSGGPGPRRRTEQPLRYGTPTNRPCRRSPLA